MNALINELVEVIIAAHLLVFQNSPSRRMSGAEKTTTATNILLNGKRVRYSFVR